MAVAWFKVTILTCAWVCNGINNHETVSSLDKIQTKSFLNEGLTTVWNLMILALLTDVYVQP